MNPLLQALQQRAEKRPQDIVLEDLERSITAIELMAQLEYLAAVLRGRGAQTIAVFMDNCASWALVDLVSQRALL